MGTWNGNGNFNGNLQLQLQLRIIPATTDDLMTKPEHGLTDWMTSTVARRTRAKSQQQQQWGKAAEGGVGNSRSSWSRRATGSCKKLQLKISRRQAKNRRRRSRNRRGKKKKPRSAANVNKKGSHSCQLFRVLFTNASRSACTTVHTAVKRPETAKKTDRQKYRAAFDRLQPHKNNRKQQQQQENIKPAGNINIGNILACCPKLSNYFDSWILTPIQPRAAADQVWAEGGGGRGATTKGQPGNTEHSVAFSCSLSYTPSMEP